MNCQLPNLNVPNEISAQLKLREKTAGIMEIFDCIRKRWVALTPEEWVRQNMVLHLSNLLDIPLSNIGNEITIKYNKQIKRCDSIVYSKQGTPLIIIEYKRPSVKITQATFDQIAVYNMQLDVPYLIVSNGVEHYFCKVDKVNNKYIFAPEGKWGKYNDL